jgi:hypothetical protein
MDIINDQTVEAANRRGAAKKAAYPSVVAARYAFFVDAKDADTAHFYARYGFVPLVSNPLTLFMPIMSFPKLPI